MQRFALATTFSLLALCPIAAKSERMVGLIGTTSGTDLVTFNSASPATLTSIGPISGVLAGHFVRAIDFRPSNGKLYALSHNAVDTGQLYTVNLNTAALTPVGPGFTLTYTLTRISIDFNPVVDRLRVVDSARDNLRLNPDTGMIAGTDSMLAYAPGDPQTGTPFIGDLAYASNVVGTLSTTVFAWDFITDSLVTIGSFGGAPTSPNSGLMFTVFTPPGPITSSASIGFDISGITGIAYLSHDNNGAPGVFQLDSINLINGVRANLGSFGATSIMDISAVVDRIFVHGFE